MPRAGGGPLLFAAGDEPLLPELAHGLEHQVTRLERLGALGAQQRGFDQRGDAVEDRRGGRSAVRSSSRLPLPPPAKCSAASRVKPPAKTARRRKRVCSSSKQVVAPGDGVAHGAQAVGQIAGAAGQEG